MALTRPVAAGVVTVDGVDVCVEAYGDRDDPAVLLIAGAAMSMDWWEPEFCRGIAERGRYVIRYDHRDTGQSSSTPAGHPTYTTAEFAGDPLRVLDALGVARAQLVGLSAGGGIAQALAARTPERVAGLALLASSAAGIRSSEQPLPAPAPSLQAVFDDPLPHPDWDDPQAVVEYLVADMRPYAGTLGFDEKRVRRIATLVVERTRDIAAAVQNHWILEGDAPAFRMSDISSPTVVLHGTDDPLFPLEHGEAMATEISGAAFVPLMGVGHEVPPPPVWDLVIDTITTLHPSEP